MLSGIILTKTGVDNTVGNFLLVRLLQNTIFRTALVHFWIFVWIEIEVRCRSSFRASWLDSVVLLPV